MRIHLKICLGLAILMLTASTPLQAEPGWGTLVGRFVVTGPLPEVSPLDPGKDSFCCEAEPQDQSLVVGPEQGLANVVLYLRPRRGSTVAVHSSYAETASDTIEIDNAGCAFEPHVVLVRTGQSLRLKNTDPTNHSVKADLAEESFHFMLAAGEQQAFLLQQPRRLPRPISCSIHPFMQGWILVRDNPYMAVTDREGRFTIGNLPAGEQELQAWHERTGGVEYAQFAGGEFDRRGRVKVTIPSDGQLDLGTIQVDAKLLTP